MEETCSIDTEPASLPSPIAPANRLLCTRFSHLRLRLPSCFSHFVLAIVLALSLPVFAKVSFDGLTLNDEDFLLFAINCESQASLSYSTLFFTQLGDQAIKRESVILTCFPERMEVASGGQFLQLCNRWGTARYSFASKTLRWTSLHSDIPTDYFRASMITQSPDGNYYCYVKRTGSSQGSLMIADCNTDAQAAIVENVPFSYIETKVKWAPSGKVFLYEKDGNVYFASPDEALGKVNLPEDLRLIGQGSIRSVSWTQDGKLVYIKGDIVYRIDENELYTRGVYAPIIGSGRIIGRLPTPFNSFKDNFWVNTDATQLAHITNDNMVSVYSTAHGEDLSFMTCQSVFPLRQLDSSAYGLRILWGTDGRPLFWVDTLDNTSAQRKSCVWGSKKAAGEGGLLQFELLFEAAESIIPVASYDGSLLAYTDGGALCVRDMRSGEVILNDTTERVVSVAWKDNRTLYAGGEESVREVNIGAASKVLFLTQARGAVWDAGRIICRLTNGSAYSYVSERNVWQQCSAQTAKSDPNEKNARYRVFTGKSPNCHFANAPYVRTLSGKVKTYAIIPQTQADIREVKRASLVFDAMESAEGIEQILATLSEFSVKATFFLNGEFIRRYPTKASQIYASGNECASLFFTPIDLVDNNFVTDSAFIKRGLARNEDEFFQATGKELALLWHAPYYRSTQAIRDAASEAGYRYVDVFPLFSDTAGFAQKYKGGSGYLTADELVESYASHLYNGIVIPISVGKGAGQRSDYLYEKLDLLISAIADAGYEIVSVRDIK